MACISSRIATVIQVNLGAIKGTITDLMSHSQFNCTGRVYLDLHGLVFETSICYWQDQPGSPPSRAVCVSTTTTLGGSDRVGGFACVRGNVRSVCPGAEQSCPLQTCEKTLRPPLQSSRRRALKTWGEGSRKCALFWEAPAARAHAARPPGGLRAAAAPRRGPVWGSWVRRGVSVSLGGKRRTGSAGGGSGGCGGGSGCRRPPPPPEAPSLSLLPGPLEANPQAGGTVRPNTRPSTRGWGGPWPTGALRWRVTFATRSGVRAG